MKPKQSSREPIAIVGMSVRLPHVNSLQDFWELLSQGKDTITEIPSDRWDVNAYYDPDLSAANKTNQKHGSMLENIHHFDPLFFSISPAEATEMNPSQKLMLELVWEAIENSTIPFNKVRGKRVGVYVGNIWSDFEHHRKHKNATVTSHSAVGQSSNIIANRVSFAFGLNGPSLVLDTGCSSSLVALHLACQSLWDSSTEMSFVGGINHILDPDQYILLSKFGGLSSKGKCSTFDIDADGFVRGEGAGVLMLKKLSQAEKDGDKIYALVKGSAVNNNGYNVNLPATSVQGQKDVLNEAYSESGIEPSEVHYVEAHGTGTKLGDPTETRALGEFFREGREDKKLRIGSVKTNVGHLEAAAGIAGLIKVVLAMKHKMLPPSINFKTPNPNIPFEELKLKVQHELGEWPVNKGETFKAGINSFGWGGTNAHTVLEEYKPVKQADNSGATQVSRYCLPLSAKSPAALKEYAEKYLKAFEIDTEDTFRDICVAASILKPSFDHRVLLTAEKKEEMIQTLNDFSEVADEVTPHQPLTAKDKVVMIFPGQGSQWLGMGRELYQCEPVFKQAIDACDKAYKPYTDWSLIDQINATEETSRLTEINVIQPALCAMQIALAKLWMSWGVVPHAVVGHSMGEVAAAHISGSLNLDDAARIICTRSRLMRTVSGKGGAMAVTELSLQDAGEVVARYPELSVAVNNSPKSTVLAGDQRAIDKVLAELESKNLFCRQVKVDVASHSQQMDPLKEELYNTVQGVTPVASSIPMYSTVKSRRMEGEELNASYWVDNLRGTVQFAAVMKQLTEEDHVVFIEVSPHPVLINAINECAEAYKSSIVSVASLYREKPEQESIYKNLGDLYAYGYDVNWEAYYQTTRAPYVELPSYPFQRERYEIEDKSGELELRKNTGKYPLLGSPILLAGAGETYFWETQLSLGAFPYMRDHQVNETPVLPGASYVEMILEAAGEIFDRGNPVITHLRFVRSITLSQEEISTVQLKVTKREEVCTFQFFVKDTESSAGVKWELLADGELRMRPKQLQEEPIEILEEATIEAVSSEQYYESLKSLGLFYGNHFQGLKEIRKSEHAPDQIQFNIVLTDAVFQLANKYKVHPALLDACFQPLFYVAVEEGNKQESRTTFLTDIGEVHSIGAIDFSKELKGVATLYPLKKDEQRGFINVEADITIYQNDGPPVLRVKNLRGKVIDTSLIEQRKEKLKNWLYKVNWVKADIAPARQKKSTQGSWVVMGDPYGLSEILIEKMARQDMNCILVTPGTHFSKENDHHYAINYANESDYSELMKALFLPERKIAGIIHAASMSYTWQDPDLTADIVEQHQVFGSISFMYLHQQLTALKLKEIPQLVIVTNGIHIVGHEQDIAQPVHSPLWGMVKVLFNELTQYNSRYFDMSANPSLEELEQMVTEIQSDNVENEIALRGKVQYVPRLGVHTEDEPHASQDKKFSPTGTYLVTGFRGLGFVFIEWMIKQGARHFALVSRSGKASPDVMKRISALESQGCEFKIFTADTGNYQQVKDVLEAIETSMNPLKGVVHAAGIIEAKTLTDLGQKEFLQILSPKVKGAWNLHLLTQHLNLDCFILFSSASTLIGLSGQGSYVAANAFLDTLAHSRRCMGLPGMSVNWGVMSDVGMVANEAELEKYAKAEGFEPVSMHDAMDVFHAIYDSHHTQIGIVKLHAESMASYYSTLAQTHYFKGLLVKEDKEEQKSSGNFLKELLALKSIEERLKALEQLVVHHVSKIVKTPASRIKSTMTFKGLGIDSLMAIQLRNLLEKNVDLKLSVAMFWSHPSIQEYVHFLNDSLSERMLAISIQNTIDKSSDASRWFVINKPVESAAFRLFCFHDAGGNSSLYHNWENLLGEQVEVVAVELPGRGRRLSETPYTQVEDLVRDLLPALQDKQDKPFMFFGHSMGGLIAFEVAKQLRRENKTLPVKLFISSTPALTTYSRREVDHTLSDEALIEMFPHLSHENIGDFELQQLLIDLLRSDLHLLNNYKYVKEEAINIPFVVIHGDSDDRVRLEQAEKWSEETALSCKVVTRPGGHRYIDHDSEFVTSLIDDEVYTEMSRGNDEEIDESVEISKK